MISRCRCPIADNPRGFSLSTEPASRTLAHRSRVFWGRSNSSAMAADLARRVYRLHILPAPSSLNASSRPDRLKRSRSEDAQVADQQEPKTMPKIKALHDETYRLLPPLDAETYAGLRANIALNGVQIPIVLDEEGRILDGFARAQIARELGYECPSVTVKGLSEQEKRSQVRALNLSRRQLDYHARRQVIADELRENSARSNNWIAKSLGVDDKTVASVRREMQSTSEIPKLGYTLGSDGKYR